MRVISDSHFAGDSYHSLTVGNVDAAGEWREYTYEVAEWVVRRVNALLRQGRVGAAWRVLKQNNTKKVERKG